MPKVARSTFDVVRIVLTVGLATPLTVACSAEVPHAEDGVGTTQGAASMAGVSTACSTPNDGCPCTSEGDEVACKGPQVTTGDYTTCTPGVRFCTGGTWGACVGKTLYENVDSLTQEYASPCPTGSQVRWNSLTLEGNAPADSSIGVSIQTAATEAALDAAPLTAVAAFDSSAPSPWPSIDVSAALASYGQTSSNWLRVTISLGKASQTGASPSVAWQQASQCMPMQ